MVGERLGLYRRRRTDGRRPHRTVITHSSEEWARVQSIAQAQGVSVPRLYERALYAGDVIAATRLSRVVTELGVVLRVMSLSASNLNQMAKVANSTGDLATAAQITAAAQHFDRQVEAVKEMLRELSRDGLFGERE